MHPEDSLFASPHLGLMHTSVTPPKRMPAHSKQALGSKKPFFVQAATPSSPARLGWEPGLRRCPSVLPCGSPRQPSRVPVCPGRAGSAQRSPWRGARRACHLCQAGGPVPAVRLCPGFFSQRCFRASIAAKPSSAAQCHPGLAVPPPPPCWGRAGGRMAGLEPGTLGRRGADGGPSRQKAVRGGRWGWRIAPPRPGLGHSHRRPAAVRARPSVRPRPRRSAGRCASPRGAPPPPPPLTGFFLRRLWRRLTTRSV